VLSPLFSQGWFLSGSHEMLGRLNFFYFYYLLLIIIELGGPERQAAVKQIPNRKINLNAIQQR